MDRDQEFNQHLDNKKIRITYADPRNLIWIQLGLI